MTREDLVNHLMKHKPCQEAWIGLLRIGTPRPLFKMVSTAGHMVGRRGGSRSH